MVSIIILLYNNADLIYDCLKSISIQKYKEYEVIIMDDCSIINNESFIMNLVNELFDDSSKVQYVRNSENLGTVASINKALHIVTGEYIKLIAADDSFSDSNSLSKVIKGFSIEANVLMSRVASCNEKMEWTGEYECDEFQRTLNNRGIDAERELAIRNKIAAQGVFFKRSFFDKWGMFDENYRLLEDWPTWLRVLRSGEKFQYLDEVTVNYRNFTGVVANANTYYLNDRKKCCSIEILGNRKYYGTICCLKAFFFSVIYSSKLLRVLYFKFYQLIHKIRGNCKMKLDN